MQAREHRRSGNRAQRGSRFATDVDTPAHSKSFRHAHDRVAAVNRCASARARRCLAKAPRRPNHAHASDQLHNRNRITSRTRASQGALMRPPPKSVHRPVPQLPLQRPQLLLQFPQKFPHLPHPLPQPMRLDDPLRPPGLPYKRQPLRIPHQVQPRVHPSKIPIPRPPHNPPNHLKLSMPARANSPWPKPPRFAPQMLPPKPPPTKKPLPHRRNGSSESGGSDRNRTSDTRGLLSVNRFVPSCTGAFRVETNSWCGLVPGRGFGL